MANKRDLAEVEQLWLAAQSLGNKFGTVAAEINEMWAEISGMSSEVLDDPDCPAEFRAEHLVASAMQLQFIQGATDLLGIPEELLARLISRWIASAVFFPAA